RTLADFGAEVIKVEPPGSGDPLRQWRLLHNGTSVWWQVQSRNKKSVVLDLREAADRDIVRGLIDEADVLVENFKPGVMEGWGLGYEELSLTNAGLIMLRISGYGQTGPYRDKPGFGVVAEAMSGLRHLTAEPGRVARVAEIDAAIGQWTLGLTVDEVLAALDKVSVPAGRIYTVADIAADPHYQARGMLDEVQMDDGSLLAVPGIVPKLSRTPGGHRRNAPQVGQDTDAVLREIGLSAEQIQALKDKGIVAGKDAGTP
ncbi:MAG: CoA transferase, partial [Polaromonas sp.]|nr:CoA transferase [Polaromonas sp.]